MDLFKDLRSMNSYTIISIYLHNKHVLLIKFLKFEYALTKKENN